MATVTLTRSQRQARIRDARTHRRLLIGSILVASISLVILAFMFGQEMGYYEGHDKACNIATITCTKMPMEP